MGTNIQKNSPAVKQVLTTGEMPKNNLFKKLKPKAWRRLSGGKRSIS